MSFSAFKSGASSLILEEEEEEKDGSSPSLHSVPKLVSPINVQSREATYSQHLSSSPLEFYYTECKGTVLENTGSTVRIKSPSTCDLSGGPLPDDSIYRLCEIQFRWGSDDQRGSEHAVNGQSFPMEVQFVHWNKSLYPDMAEALGKPNGIAIIALFAQIGIQNNGLQMIAQNLWQVRFKEEIKPITSRFNPESLLPHPSLRDYWTYEGTSTCPPFSENVTWILMRYPMTLSPQQIEEFRQLLTYEKGGVITSGSEGFLVNNFRDVQSVQGHAILASFEGI